MAEGPVHLPHLFVHLGDPQPEKGESRFRGRRRPAGPESLFSRRRRSQSHDVGVGGVHGDADGVVLVLVFGVVVGSSLQKEANEAATQRGKRCSAFTCCPNTTFTS